MTEITIDQLKTKAQEFAQDHKKWHFHILTPGCQLNDTDRYALVLENTTDGESFACFSDEPYMGVGKELVKLLHGDDVVKEDSGEEKSLEPSEQVKKILEKAGQLRAEGKPWHHHMLFPGCKYNKYGDKWVIIFEDKEAGEIIEAISDDEPKSDLEHIETLFYQQKKAA